MAAKFDPPLTIAVASSAGPLVFHEVAEARAWIERELEVWGPYWADPWPSVGNPYWAPLRRLQKTIPGIRNAIATAEADTSHEIRPDNYIGAFGAYKNGDCLHSGSALAKRAIELLSAATTQAERRSAAAFLGAATNANVKFSEIAQLGEPSIPWFLGMINYSSLSASPVDARRLLDSTIEATLGKWESVLNDQKGKHLGALESITQTQTSISEAFQQHQTAFAKQIDDNKKQLAEVKEFYTEELRTQAPTKYWTDKAETHSRLGKWFLAAFAAAAVGLAGTAYALGLDLVAAIAQAQGNAADGLVGLETALSRFLVFLVPTFFAVWLLRIVLRIALSNLALADDARHRVTLIQTFRSLLEDQKKLEAPDRILMLQALFRPLPGAREDESAPPNWFDVLVSRIKPGK